MGETYLQKATISGSYQKFPEELEKARQEFQDCGVSILSPQSAQIVSSIDGFVSLKGDLISNLASVSENFLPDAIKLVENTHLQAITSSDLLWLFLPKGYCGIATAFEIGWALAHNIPVYAAQKDLLDSKEYTVTSYVQPAKSISHLINTYDLAQRKHVNPLIGRLILNNIMPQLNLNVNTKQNSTHNSTIAVGAIIEDHSTKKYKKGQERDILVVQTHKWKNKFSIVGGIKKPDEKINDAWEREVKEQTGLESKLDDFICTFDELPESGYYIPGTNRVFSDRVIKVCTRTVQLNSQAQSFIWIPPTIALRDLDIEPNARTTIELYAQKHKRIA